MIRKTKKKTWKKGGVLKLTQTQLGQNKSVTTRTIRQSNLIGLNIFLLSTEWTA